ncbi:hypothetical protein [Flavobacterium chungangense]|uniref:Uncharacterized protein n=1 Tax=Flavobacterium chungangense TaxID=554283 RepID=A0A6V6YP16_9FLAO|nr:hypothetical protein [Flavobacterium chungangense]CAD0001126.1 hypothetical protein FLACHUCJ7_00390 [Flavobacterium chungangense]
MYNTEPSKYSTDFYRFLKNKDDNRISLKKLFCYIIAVIIIVAIGQTIVENSDPYKSENIENEKFIKAEIKPQIIFDTITVPMKQTFFKTYFAIQLIDGSIYRLNLINSKNENKIVKNVIIEKKANDKTFEIINKNIRYKFKISELDNFGERIFVFFASIFFCIIGIPLWLNKNELEKEYEKKTVTANSSF